jgi:UDP-N-acetylglucosamine transferase subunit ALG13
MIFITVGTDQPFDRMIKIVDSWASAVGRRDIFAQIGEGGWKPRFIPHTNLLSPADFNQLFNKASVIVSHAGMGTILSALHHGKPILVMPKLASLREHRNEHQLATAKRMQNMGYTNVALNKEEMEIQLARIEIITPLQQIPKFATGRMIEGIKDFIAKV